MVASADKIAAHIRKQLQTLDGTPEEKKRALTSVGGAMAMVESLILHDVGPDSPFLGEVDRIRKKRLGGIAGLALQVSEARMHYNELLSLLEAIAITLGE